MSKHNIKSCRNFPNHIFGVDCEQLCLIILLTCVDATVATLVAFWTDTGVTIDPVMAGSSIEARLTATFIHIHFTVGSCTERNIQIHDCFLFCDTQVKINTSTSTISCSFTLHQN